MWWHVVWFGAGVLVGGLAVALLLYVILPLTGPRSRGDSAYLDDLWAGCQAGDMPSCDTLYWASPLWSEYESYGRTCGQRVPNPGELSCVDLAPREDADALAV